MKWVVSGGAVLCAFHEASHPLSDDLTPILSALEIRETACCRHFDCSRSYMMRPTLVCVAAGDLQRESFHSPLFASITASHHDESNFARSSHDQPKHASAIHRLSEAAQGLRPFLQPTKHNHSSSKEGAAIVAEWRSQGEDIITKHFAYTTMVGDAHPPGEPRTTYSEVNRVAHTLSHLEYAYDEVNDWLLTHVSGVHNGTGLNSLMVCLDKLEGVRTKALQELQHTNEK